jgi:phosphoribosylanthranilate isomerase
MTLTIKICGLSNEPTLDAALDAGADMIGLVFHAASPRLIGTGRAAELAARTRGRAEIVALTVDADDAALREIIAAVRPDWLQLHGSETPERVAAISDRFGIRTMKAIAVRDRGDPAAAGAYAETADMILFDAKPPKGASRPGGHGVPFDWSLLAEIPPSPPFMLSGGLNPGNVAEAIAKTSAMGVDVSSGVETAPGKKDVDLIRGFIAAARKAASVPAEVSP